MNPAGLYIHIPYCKRKCSYCCFHFSTNLTTQLELLEALNQEITERSHELSHYQIETLYFGGGTPSLLGIDNLNQLLIRLYSNYNIKSDAEITLEANPDDLNEDYCKRLFELGINRLSIGIQSFEQKDLNWMNRAHHAEQSRTAIEFSLKAGFTNLSIDLMYGLPFMTEKSWNKNLEIMKSYQIPHFSAYALTIEERTALMHAVKNNTIQIPLEPETLAQMDLLLDFCQRNQYEAYEISNFSKEGFRSKHNSSYWEGVAYLGFGPSAHSFIGTTRRWNRSNNNEYIKAIKNKQAYYQEEQLSLKDQCNEFVMLQLRRIEGLDLNLILQRFPTYYPEIQHELIRQVQLKNIEQNKNYFSLSRQGKYIADSITSNLFVSHS